MPIEGVSNIVRMPRLGKLRLGIKVEKPGKHPYPQATDYFVCPHAVQEVFGERPTELEIMFPTEDPGQFAQQWLRCYSLTQGLVCIGDGLVCRRKVDADTGAMASHETKNWEWKEGLPCNAQDCPDFLFKRCRRVMNLQVLIPKVRGLGVWQIDTTSFYSMVNINSMVALLKQLAGRCCFIPLKLCLGPLEVTPPGQSKKTVHVMYVKQDMTLAEIARIALAPAPQALIPPPETEEVPEELFPREALAPEEVEVEHKVELPDDFSRETAIKQILGFFDAMEYSDPTRKVWLSQHTGFSSLENCPDEQLEVALRVVRSIQGIQKKLI